MLWRQLQNYRIAGTVPEIFSAFEYKKGSKYKLQSGEIFKEDFEAVIGSDAAEMTGLKTGDFFTGSHGIESYEGSQEQRKQIQNFRNTGKDIYTF